MKLSTTMLPLACALGILSIAATSAQAGEGNRDIGVGVQFGNSTSFGVEARANIGESISVRPSVYFGYQPGAENAGVIPGSAPAGSVTFNGTGIQYGLAVTYDFKLDPEGRTRAFLGPKVAFSSGTGSASFNGVEIPASQATVNETKIGMVVGAETALSDSFMVGANATINFSRSVGGTNTNGTTITDIQPRGSSIDFGVRAAYRF
jgi:Outer membrane protein beta-barrel domain